MGWLVGWACVGDSGGCLLKWGPGYWSNVYWLPWRIDNKLLSQANVIHVPCKTLQWEPCQCIDIWAAQFLRSEVVAILVRQGNRVSAEGRGCNRGFVSTCWFYNHKFIASVSGLHSLLLAQYTVNLAVFLQFAMQYGYNEGGWCTNCSPAITMSVRSLC